MSGNQSAICYPSIEVLGLSPEGNAVLLRLERDALGVLADTSAYPASELFSKLLDCLDGSEVGRRSYPTLPNGRASATPLAVTVPILFQFGRHGA